MKFTFKDPNAIFPLLRSNEVVIAFTLEEVKLFTSTAFTTSMIPVTPSIPAKYAVFILLYSSVYRS